MVSDFMWLMCVIVIGGFFNDNFCVMLGSLFDLKSGYGYGFEFGVFYRFLWVYGEFGV